MSNIDHLFDQADDPAWQQLMQRTAQAVDLRTGADADLYAACFNTPAGRAVLDDFYAMFVNVTRCVPGESMDAAFYREGMAYVLFYIVSRIKEAENGPEET